MATLKDFADLKGLRSTLKEQEQARAVEKAEREKRERLARQEANLFRDSLGGVKVMPKSDKLEPFAPKRAAPAPVREAERPRTQAEEDAQVLRESLSDLFDVDGLLDEDPSLSYARDGVGPDVVRKLRKRHWPVQDELDMHGMDRDTARDQLGDFLRRAERRGVRCVRVIHGKGLGSAGGEPVLRSIVHSWLVQKNEVIAFCVANKADGGYGALIVLLKAALQF
ncbi:MAG: Smr/MutS family protein [Pseudomonadota bacterium]